MEEIRFATFSDLNQILTLENLCFIHPWTKEQYEYEFKENEFSKTIVIVEDHIVVGFINYWITFDQGQINKICVQENQRRKGLATKLMNQAFEEFRKNNCLAITLEVRVSNRKAQNLYQKYGFQTVLTKKGYYSDGEDAYYMIKGAY